MIYHYCERRYAKCIIDEGEMKPNAVFVSPNADGSDHKLLSPVVWFTDSPDLSPTVEISVTMKSGGEPMVWVRFCCTDDVAPLRLRTWAQKHGYTPDLFFWMIASANLAGEDWLEWRLAEEPVKRAQWVSVEWFNGKEWVPVDVPTGT